MLGVRHVLLPELHHSAFTSLSLTMSDSTNDTLDQAEHEQISTSLEVEKIEVNLFRSKSLWLPLRARGVFGG